MSKILYLKSENFSKTLYDPHDQQERVVLVFFSASWCPPCKNMSKVFESLAELFSSTVVQFASIDVAQSPTLAPSYGIKSVPRIAIFQGGYL